MTIASYKTKLTTAATTATLGFLFGWFDEINAKLRDDTLTSPFVVVEPTKWILNKHQDSFTIPFKCNAYIRKATTREAAFDSLITKVNAFITAINTDASLNVNLSPEGDLIDFGSVVENYYVIKIETEITIWC